MYLDQDKSFYCVVDGMIQVFAQAGQPMARQSSWDHEDMNGYQLLNEVRSGGTLSSLFTILSLFTEDVKMSWQDEPPNTDVYPSVHDSSVPTRRRADSDISQLDLESRRRHGRSTSISSTASTVHAQEALSPTRSGTSSPYHLGSTPTPSFSLEEQTRPGSVHRGVVARAAEDTTLAVIPAEAFRRLTKNFPKATGHIVQGTTSIVFKQT